MQALNITLVQGNTRWHDTAANRDYYTRLIHAPEAAADRADLIVLPETFLSGFSNDAAGQGIAMDGPELAWLADLAREVDAVITGSLIVAEGAQHRNRLFWMRPDGSFEIYDKRHLFRMAGEHQHYRPGEQRVVVEVKGWRVCPLICYDLRFPVWSRNRRHAAAQGGMDYDLLLYVANWPAARRQAWRTLLAARAIENQACCVGVNRTGVDGNGVHYVGDSAAHDASGERLLELGVRERVYPVVLQPEPMLALRRDFPVWMDADAEADA